MMMLPLTRFKVCQEVLPVYIGDMIRYIAYGELSYTYPDKVDEMDSLLTVTSLTIHSAGLLL